MILIVTGVPGTGKSTIAKKLCDKLDLTYVDLGDFARKNGFVKGFDNARDCEIVDETGVCDVLDKMDNIVVDGHFSQFIEGKKVILCIVLRCDVKVLRERLKERGYDSRKIDENVECEIMNVCGNEAFAHGHKILELDTSKLGIDECVSRIRVVLDEE